MDQKIDVLIVEPGKEPRLTTVADDLEHLQQIVGGPIEAGCYLPQRVMLICNGEGKNMGLPPNRPNPTDSEDTICGTFLLCSFLLQHQEQERRAVFPAGHRDGAEIVALFACFYR